MDIPSAPIAETSAPADAESIVPTTDSTNPAPRADWITSATWHLPRNLRSTKCGQREFSRYELGETGSATLRSAGSGFCR